MNLIEKFMHQTFIGKKLKEPIKLFDYKYELFYKFIKGRKWPQMTILFYPQLPYKKTKVFRFCICNNFNVTNNINGKFDLAIFWQDETFKQANEKILKLAKEQKVINIDCLDISKQKVDQIFSEVFGYSSFIDPLTCCGQAIKKSDINARHDGEIIACPIKSTEPGFIYQKAINNFIAPDICGTIRVSIFAQKAQTVYYKYKPKGHRFSTDRQWVFIKNLSEIFSDEELSKINLFCERFNFDFGELDILRDNDNGLIYIIDANNTSYNFTDFTLDDNRKIINILSDNFKDFVSLFVKSN